MPDPQNTTRDAESGIDVEQGQGMGLSFIPNRLVQAHFLLQMTTTTHPLRNLPTKIKDRLESPTFPMVLKLFFPCISVGPGKRTVRWQRVGKGTLMGCLSS